MRSGFSFCRAPKKKAFSRWSLDSYLYLTLDPTHAPNTWATARQFLPKHGSGHNEKAWYKFWKFQLEVLTWIVRHVIDRRVLRVGRRVTIMFFGDGSELTSTSFAISISTLTMWIWRRLEIINDKSEKRLRLEELKTRSKVGIHWKIKKKILYINSSYWKSKASKDLLTRRVDSYMNRTKSCFALKQLLTPLVH